MAKHKPSFTNFVRRQSPLQSPHWRWWHTLLFLGFLVALLLTFFMPGWMADVAATEVGTRDWFMRLRLGLIGGMIFNIFWARAVPWWRVLAYMAITFGLLGNIARNETMTRNPLTLSFACLLVGLLIEVVAVAARPNVHERLRTCEADMSHFRDRALGAEEKLAGCTDIIADRDRTIQAKDNKIAALEDGFEDYRVLSDQRIHKLENRLLAAGLDIA